jgi:hypothetical protein
MLWQWRVTLMASLAVVMLAAVALGASAGGAAQSAEPWVAKVDGEPLSARLFERRLTRSRAAAYRYFGQKYNVSDSADFWTTPHDGETPLDWLKVRTLDECVRILVEQKLARDHGVLADASYLAFLQRLERENQRRREAVAAGEPIYGPQQYGEDEYFSYSFTNMVIELKRRLAADEFAASDDVLRQRYEQSKDMLYSRGDRVVALAIRVPFARRSEKGLTRDEAQGTIAELRAKLTPDATLEGLEASCGTAASVEETAFDDSSARADGMIRAVARSEAMKLSPGQLSPVFEERMSFWVMKCVSREPLGYRPFDEVKDNVRLRYVDEKYGALVIGLASKAQVDINRDVYNAIRAR